MSERQKSIIEGFLQAPEKPWGCRASAGTGKTHLLMELYKRLLETGIEPARILAVTFSRNAAYELEARAQKILRQFPSLTPPAHLPIYTIHGFCRWILSQEGYRLGLSPGFRILSPADVDRRCLEEAEKLILTQEDEKLSHLLTKVSPLVIAKWLVRLRTGTATSWYDTFSSFETMFQEWSRSLRILEQSQAAFSWILRGENLTPTLEKSRTEVLEPLRSLCQRLEQTRDLTEELYRCIETLMTAFSAARVKAEGHEAKLAFLGLKEVLKEWPSPSISQPLFLSVQAQSKQLLELAEIFRTTVARVQLEESWVGYDDLELLAHKVLHDYPDVRAQVRSKFSVVMLDECQDTNDRQWSVLSQWLGKDLAGLFAVGDVKQSLYRFRGANPQTFLSMMQSIEAVGGTTTQLTDHYRSHTTLLESINTISSSLFGEEEAPTLIAHQNSASAEMAWITGTEPMDEARLCASACLELHQKHGVPFSEMTVLLRHLKTHIDTYQKAFQEFRIPVFIDSGHEFFQDSLVHTVLASARWYLDSTDNLSLWHLLATGLFPDFQMDALPKLPRGAALSESLSPLLSPLENDFLEGLLNCEENNFLSFWMHHPLVAAWFDSAPLPTLERMKLHSLDALFHEIYPPTGTSRLESFCDFIESARERGEQLRLPLPQQNAVCVRTVHAAKGLQARVVLLPQLGTSTTPKRAETDYFGSHHFCLRPRRKNGSSFHHIATRHYEDLEQKRQAEDSLRVLYVALTRGIERVWLLKPDEPKDDSWFEKIIATGVPLTTHTLPPPYALNIASEKPYVPAHRSELRPVLADLKITEVASRWEEATPAPPSRGFTPPLATLAERAQRIERGLALHRRFQLDTDFETKFWQQLDQKQKVPFPISRCDKSRELPVVATLGPVRLTGRLDALWSSENHHLIIDYKSRLHCDPATFQEQQQTLQLELYALCLKHHFPKGEFTCALVDGLREKAVFWTVNEERLARLKERLLSDLALSSGRNPKLSARPNPKL